MNFSRNLSLLTVIGALSACGAANETTPDQKVAPGAPGVPSVWAFAGKTGIGTSYEAYSGAGYDDQGVTGPVSKVWFSVAQGILTETMFGMIHEAQIKDMQFLIKGEGFLDTEKDDTISTIDYLYKNDAGRPLSLAYRIVNRDREGKYEIEKHIFTDPDGQTLYMKVIFRALAGEMTPYLSLNPHMANTGSGDQAQANLDGLTAWEGDRHLTVKSSRSFVKASAGFVGRSDGVADLGDNGVMDWQYVTTGDAPGNVALTAELDKVTSGEVTYDFTLGFGVTAAASESAATETLAKGYDAVLAAYNGIGEAVGWEDYLKSLSDLPQMVGATTDGGKLLYTSALVLKAQEDKTHAGALIASLSNPWGETASAEAAATGYKAVWPRDFYQCAMAFLALGDRETPLRAFNYLEKVQVSDKTSGNKGATGWFLQKTHVNGDLEWVGVQLDQTAMPIMLGWKLHQAGILSDEKLRHWYQAMLKPAADFLVKGGEVQVGWNKQLITPPKTQQERWEEQTGYSPSTTAAVIAGLVTAADIARLAGDEAGAVTYLAAADDYEAKIEARMFTTKGTQETGAGNGRYYLRITANEDPNDDGVVSPNNGRSAMAEQDILDGGFLELVRYGVRPADHAAILDTLPELDDQTRDDALRVKYDFSFEGVEGTFPGWRRYGNDGYGEDASDGRNYGKMSPGQRGRVWPFFTGERGHYELARAGRDKVTDEEIATLKNTYVRGMELFANDGMMLPEQVWDGVGVNSPAGYVKGEGTNSATPLAWTHAEYVKLVRSLSDRKVWDHYSVVGARYGK
ncbi:glucan 1,4-alpha-glucosidase [Paremcibacter congregatus]|uniref:Glucan 1,4-alpha-glucosidase n=1 Tax=Paremcibacter congregatus TaxID=2043170 RepID=A0A2G4YS27_9PROT|nr:glucan 1,4-alpha-glucosidase [Paremcibacter congregatus]PHZ85125.1 glucan 1,4-alpha-glucosidase [Paremcibacter congregatus]QDE27938.1 glucan 1,4-alpha-glucosidase [Paremcibacter congregatus]